MYVLTNIFSLQMNDTTVGREIWAILEKIMRDVNELRKVCRRVEGGEDSGR